MSYGIKRYNQNSATQMTSRQIEVMAFGQTILLLKNAKNQKERIHALTMNQKLWSSILLETSVEDNEIPDVIRKDRSVMFLSLIASFCRKTLKHDFR